MRDKIGFNCLNDIPALDAALNRSAPEMSVMPASVARALTVGCILTAAELEKHERPGRFLLDHGERPPQP